MNTVDKYKTYGPSPTFLNIQTEKDTYYIPIEAVSDYVINAPEVDYTFNKLTPTGEYKTIYANLFVFTADKVEQTILLDEAIRDRGETPLYVHIEYDNGEYVEIAARGTPDTQVLEGKHNYTFNLLFERKDKLLAPILVEIVFDKDTYHASKQAIIEYEFVSSSSSKTHYSYKNPCGEDITIQTDTLDLTLKKNKETQKLALALNDEYKNVAPTVYISYNNGTRSRLFFSTTENYYNKVYNMNDCFYIFHFSSIKE